jgi:predicted TIM-barrel fold metal-dependent hydrolase
VDAREAILEPELPIIDPHHHLWDHRSTHVGDNLPPPRHGFDATVRMAPRYLFEELLADMTSGHNVIATVYLQGGAMCRADGDPAYRPVGETEFVNGVAAMSASGLYGDVRACAGIVGHADLTSGSAVKGVLEAHIAAGGGRFRGVRHLAAYDPDPAMAGILSHGGPGLYAQPGFREGFAQLAPMGLSFDAWVLEPQIGDVVDLARAFPDTTIVLDHVGSPLGIGSYAGRMQERFSAWRESIRALAGSPNAVVKLGGLGTMFQGFPSFLASPPAPSTQLAEEWRPYVETCIEAFGPERCMFESNFPVDRGACAYDVLWNAFKILSAGCSPDEKKNLFSDTARRVYRLNL